MKNSFGLFSWQKWGANYARKCKWVGCFCLDTKYLIRTEKLNLVYFQFARKKVKLFYFRLAQFYKDVELAEVMTDNSPKVGEILQLYEIEGEDWSNEKDKGGNDDEEQEGRGEEEEEVGEENPPTENFNPNSGSAGSKKRKQTEGQNKTEKAKKKKS